MQLIAKSLFHQFIYPFSTQFALKSFVVKNAFTGKLI